MQVLAAEPTMEKAKMDETLQMRLLPLLAEHCNDQMPFFLVLLGLPCTGKSTVSQQLQNEISDPRIVSAASYAVPRTMRQQLRLHGLERESYNIEQMQSDVQSFLSRQSVEISEYSFLSGEPNAHSQMLVPGSSVYILEGLGWLHVLDLIPSERRFVVFFVHDHLSNWMKRSLYRDVKERSYSCSEVTTYLLKRLNYFGIIIDELESKVNLWLNVDKDFSSIAIDYKMANKLYSDYLSHIASGISCQAATSGPTEYRLKILEKEIEMVQNIIGRYDTLLFTIKGWAITLWSACIGWGIKASKPELIALSAAIPLPFWLIDGIFKRHQRGFRWRAEKISDFLKTDLDNVFLAGFNNDFRIFDVKGKLTNSAEAGYKSYRSLWKAMFYKNVYAVYIALMFLSLLFSTIFAYCQ